MIRLFSCRANGESVGVCTDESVVLPTIGVWQARSASSSDSSSGMGCFEWPFERTQACPAGFHRAGRRAGTSGRPPAMMSSSWAPSEAHCSCVRRDAQRRVVLILDAELVRVEHDGAVGALNPMPMRPTRKSWSATTGKLADVGGGRLASYSSCDSICFSARLSACSCSFSIHSEAVSPSSPTMRSRNVRWPGWPNACASMPRARPKSMVTCDASAAGSRRAPQLAPRRQLNALRIDAHSASVKAITGEQQLVALLHARGFATIDSTRPRLRKEQLRWRASIRRPGSARLHAARTRTTRTSRCRRCAASRSCSSSTRWTSRPFCTTEAVRVPRRLLAVRGQGRPDLRHQPRQHLDAQGVQGEGESSRIACSPT